MLYCTTHADSRQCGKQEKQSSITGMSAFNGTEAALFYYALVSTESHLHFHPHPSAESFSLCSYCLMVSNLQNQYRNAKMAMNAGCDLYQTQTHIYTDNFHSYDFRTDFWNYLFNWLPWQFWCFTYVIYEALQATTLEFLSEHLI